MYLYREKVPAVNSIKALQKAFLHEHSAVSECQNGQRCCEAQLPPIKYDELSCDIEEGSITPAEAYQVATSVLVGSLELCTQQRWTDMRAAPIHSFEVRLVQFERAHRVRRRKRDPKP